MKNIDLKSSFYLISVICLWVLLIEFVLLGWLEKHKMCEHVSTTIFQTQKRGSFGRYCDQFQSILFVIRKSVMNEICFYASISCMCFKREDPNHIQYVCIVIYLPYKNNQEREH